MALVVFYIQPADVDAAMGRITLQFELQRSQYAPDFWDDKYGNSIITMRDSLVHDEVRWSSGAPEGVEAWIAYHTDVRWERAHNDASIAKQLLDCAAELCDAADVNSFVAIYDAVGIETLLMPEEYLAYIASLTGQPPTTLASRTFPARGADPRRVFSM